MLTDFREVAKFIRLLDNYISKGGHNNLADIKRGRSRSVLEELYRVSNYGKSVRYGVTTYRNIDVDVSRDISDMTYDDIMNFLNMVRTNQIGDFIIIHYDELKCWKNPFVSKQSMYDVYSGLLRECRGIVIDIRTFDVISVPYYKFMNMGELYDGYSEQDILNRLKSAYKVEFAEKMDGSFIQITYIGKGYSFYPYECLIASSSNLQNEHILNLSRNWYQSNSNYQQLVKDYPDWTVLFEAIFPENKGVVEYDKSDEGLWLIGMRNKTIGELKCYSELQTIAYKYGIRATRIFQGSYTELRQQLSNMKGSQMEGYVCNIDGFLVKMKTEDYIRAVTDCKAGLSVNGVIKSIDSGTFDDIAGNLSDKQKEEAYNIMEIYNSLLSARQVVYEVLTSEALSYKGMQSAISSLPSSLRCIGKALLDDSDKGKLLIDILLNHPLVKKATGKSHKTIYYSLPELYEIRNELSIFDIIQYRQAILGVVIKSSKQ